VRAIIEAAIECQKSGVKVLPEIMHPLTLDRKELSILEQATRRVAEDLIKRSGVKLNYLVGTMIELPARRLAGGRDRRSGGSSSRSGPTTSRKRPWVFPATTLAASAGLRGEKKAAVFSADPFQSLDTKGVGMLMRWGIEQGRKTRPKLKIGNLRRTRRRCGQREVLPPGWHGLRQCFAVSRTIARLAAAQVVVEEEQSKKKRGK